MHGWPRILISDRDPRFDSDFWKAVIAGSGTKLRMSTPYHPQTDGRTERTNRTLLSILRKVAVASGPKWEEQLLWLEFAYNDSQQCSTGYTPFFLNTGGRPHVPLRSLVTSALPLVPGDSPGGLEFNKRLSESLDQAKHDVARVGRRLAAGRLRQGQARQGRSAFQTKEQEAVPQASD